jgi:CRISPR/Cas system-associated exonuclease Cas4 (RecB family)
MAVPNNFQFSQSSLQDYVDCPRRFQLRYIQRRSWPALESEPAMDHEVFMQRGAQFHQMAHQYLLGVPGETISRLINADEVIQRWWRNFESLPKFEHQIYPEISLSAPIDEFRIMAKYDLLSINTQDVKATIYDWKTSLKRPQRKNLIDRLQTRVYPYLLVKAGAQFTPQSGNPISPDQVEMIYWFTDYPDEPAHFPYSQKQFEADEAYLYDLVAKIKTQGDEDAPLTDDEWRCRFCKFRSLCNRGVEAGPLEEIDLVASEVQGFDLDLDFDQVAEIEF